MCIRDRHTPDLIVGDFDSVTERTLRSGAQLVVHAYKDGHAPGAALVGDAADFFDPFTGEGIYAALRGGELLTSYAFEAARATTTRQSRAAAPPTTQLVRFTTSLSNPAHPLRRAVSRPQSCSRRSVASRQ